MIALPCDSGRLKGPLCPDAKRSVHSIVPDGKRGVGKRLSNKVDNFFVACYPSLAEVQDHDQITYPVLALPLACGAAASIELKVQTTPLSGEEVRVEKAWPLRFA